MATRSKRLWAPTTVGTVSAVVYTCPDNETSLVKLITVVNIATLGATSFRLRLNGDDGAQLLAWRLVANSADLWLEGFIVLQPGDQLHAQAGQASLIVAGFGAQLEGVAD